MKKKKYFLLNLKIKFLLINHFLVKKLEKSNESDAFKAYFWFVEK